MAENILDKIPYEKIQVIPPWQRWLAAFGVIFLFFVAYYFVSYKNTTEEINKLALKREELKTDYKRFAQVAKRIPQLQKEINVLSRKLKKARIQLPSAKEIPELLTLISDTGTNKGLEFLLFRPLPEQKADFYSQVPVEMKILGSFHDVAVFFDEVKKMSRIVNISNVKIRNSKVKSKAKYFSLEASFKATTYKYLRGAALKATPKK